LRHKVIVGAGLQVELSQDDRSAMQYRILRTLHTLSLSKLTMSKLVV